VVVVVVVVVLVEVTVVVTVVVLVVVLVTVVVVVVVVVLVTVLVVVVVVVVVAGDSLNDCASSDHPKFPVPKLTVMGAVDAAVSPFRYSKPKKPVLDSQFWFGTRKPEPAMKGRCVQSELSPVVPKPITTDAEDGVKLVTESDSPDAAEPVELPVVVGLIPVHSETIKPPYVEP